MSIKSWKEEFYPISARDLYKYTHEDALLIAHCIQKWEGASFANLQVHDICKIDSTELHEMDGEGYITFGAGTCALCQKYIMNSVFGCDKCPLVKVDKKFECEKGTSPYKHYIYHADPQPMLDALKDALVLVATERLQAPIQDILSKQDEK